MHCIVDFAAFTCIMIQDDVLLRAARSDDDTRTKSLAFKKRRPLSSDCIKEPKTRDLPRSREMKKQEADELSLQLKHERQRRSVAEDNMKQLIEELRKANEEKESLKKQLTDQLTQGRWKLGYIFIVYCYSECSCF